MIRKRQYAILGALLVTALIVASAPLQVAAKDTLIIGMQDNTVTLDPARIYEITALGIGLQLYDTLVKFNPGDFTQVVPALAESWDVGEDGKTWTFHIRRGVKFASGNPVNADAVVFSLQRTLRLADRVSWMLTQFGLSEESISKLDEHTVQIVLNRIYAPGVFLTCLIGPHAGILDPQIIMEHEQDGDMGSAWLDDHSAGSGPFVLTERIREKPAQYILTANEHYWGEKPSFQKIIVKEVGEPVEQMIHLQEGTIDVAWNLQPDQVQMLTGAEGVQINQNRSVNIRYLMMNLGYEPLRKPEVRDAIRYAIDYDRLIEVILAGGGVKTQTFIPKGIFGHNPAAPYNRDLKKAQQLLSEADYPDGFEVTLFCFDSSPWIDIATKIKSDLAEIGIRVTVTPQTPKQTLQAMRSREYQLVLMQWLSDYADPDGNAKGFAHCNSLGDDAMFKLAAWQTNYLTPETSKLVEQASQELNMGKREALYEQITNMILDDGPFAFLYSPTHHYGVRSEVADHIGAPDNIWNVFPTVK